ncbi:hypothetical protein EDM00_11535 [Ornithobacterium rhinotracheale]|uniref:hypothetical protein n=1 Tax=Ornithobacterium rhinotracheale TaxID=28251 RepID=UPI00129D1576|nr:hypothetical protein [Ornithobacterium rhinotracheale]MRI64611.1 hypothetical protein [Ornithobacterium rhinotracheale]
MNYNKNEAGNLLPLTVTEGVTVNVLPYEQYEYLMTTREVAHGYGTTMYVVRMALARHADELIENKHFIKGCNILLSPQSKGVQIQPHQVFWTKRGIVRLGFFIKSERAKLFRDWAEELIIKVDEQRDLFGEVVVPKMLPKRKHNRLTPTRMVEILADVAKIEDKALRLSLIQKLGV